MSLLIKGAEMPKGCITCTFKSESLFNRTMWCEWLDDPLGDYSKCDEKWRHPDCPLVEVHVPHGRLIDAEKLFKKGINLDWSLQKWVSEVDIGLMPTIIEAEEGENHE